MTLDPKSSSSNRSPLYEAYNAPRYDRQEIIRNYQEDYSCRLITMIDVIFPDSITLLEETLHDADPSQDLHIMLSTPGGDGETAIRLIRQVQSRCRNLTVIVPDQAKSVGTLFALGAHRMGPTSDLGPVDPQFQLADGSLAAGKAIIAAVEDAERRIQMNPQTYPLHASLLADISALMVQQAKDALARASAQLKEALSSVPERDEKDVKRLAERLHNPLIGEPRSHATTIPAAQAAEYGLPVKQVNSDDPQWKTIWRLWTKYKALDASRIYEGEIASVVA